jgi:hypothetical protein
VTGVRPALITDDPVGALGEDVDELSLSLVAPLRAAAQPAACAMSLSITEHRRGWATSRKHLPTADVAAAGGWSDVTTLIRCYQQADDDTLLRVMNEPRKVTERAKSG